jgi:hypothetical protein
MKVSFDTTGRNGVVTSVTCINLFPENEEDEMILAAMPDHLEEIPFWISKGGKSLGLTLRNEEYNNLCGMSPAASLK